MTQWLCDKLVDKNWIGEQNIWLDSALTYYECYQNIKAERKVKKESKKLSPLLKICSLHGMHWNSALAGSEKSAGHMQEPMHSEHGAPKVYRAVFCCSLLIGLYTIAVVGILGLIG